MSASVERVVHENRQNANMPETIDPTRPPYFDFLVRVQDYRLDAMRWAGQSSAVALSTHHRRMVRPVLEVLEAGIHAAVQER